MWDDERPEDRRERGRGQTDGSDRDPFDDDTAAPDGLGSFGDREPTGTSGGPQTRRGKATMLVVVTVVLLTTVILCCVAISQAASLIHVDPNQM